MGCRREERVDLRLTTMVSGLDRYGRPFSELAETLDISTLGARLAGLNAEVEEGAIVSIIQSDRSARFRVLWVGEKGSSTEGQVGLRCVEVARSTSKNVLYVSSFEFDLATRGTSLRSGGYTVTVADSAQQAWKRLQEDRFDLIVLDYPLLDIDATTLASHIRRYWPAMKILVVSANPGRIPEELLEITDEWIHKGSPAAALCARVAELIGTPTGMKWPLARTTSRHAIHVPVTLRLFRSGSLVFLEGRSTDLSITGMGAEFEDQLLPGELGTIIFRLPLANSDTSYRVMVRRRDGKQCGLEFLDVSNEQALELQQLCEILPQAEAPH